MQIVAVPQMDGELVTVEEDVTVESPPEGWQGHFEPQDSSQQENATAKRSTGAHAPAG